MVALERGSRLGRYEIVAPIGAGGMGEVYRATDSALRRDVALKILPQTLLEDPTRGVRFEQEARAMAALQHPNIVTIHDFGTDGETPYLVTELLAGESLSDVLVRGPVPLRRALAWSLEILRGMAAAHAHGIVHRDLKPGNIFVLGDGSVKILDFGLAKIAEGSASQFADAPTARISSTGTLLGTIGYMAPEQIRGETADARSDIFAFAVVLHEMLTGRSPFLRASSAETLTAILRDDPPRLETPPFPAILASTVQRCLDKSPNARFHSAHDLALHLEMIEIAGSGGTAVTLAEAAAPPRMEQVTFRRGHIMHARFAPDGSIVYGASWNERPLELFASHRGMPESRALGVRGSIHAISRNGELAVSLERRSEVGFQFFGTLARVAMVAGVPRPIANAVYEADWSPDGKQLAIVRRGANGFRVEYPIGNPLYESPSWISDMRVSPSGNEIGFIEHPFAGDNSGYVKVVDVQRNVERLTGDLYIAWGLAWNPVNGELWYSASPALSDEARNVSVYAVARNRRPREVFASLGPILLHDIAPNGTVLVSAESVRRPIVGHTADAEFDRDLSWFDWSFPMRLSADGRTLLIEEQGVASRGKYTFYVRPTDGGPAVRLDEGRSRDLSADGEYVLAFRDDTPGKLLLVPTGVGEMREIPMRGIDRVQTARFLPGDRGFTVVGSSGSESSRLWHLAAAGGDARPVSEPIIASWFFVALSPDGSRVALIGPDRLPLMFSTTEAIPPQAVRGAERGDAPVHWRSENELLVVQRVEPATTVYAIDLTSGARRFERTLRPPDAAGVEEVFPIHYASASDSYVFGYRLLLSSLFVVEGLR